MVLTREEKEKLVLDLYNEGKSTREIAPITHISFRDIGCIIDKKEKEKETIEGQVQQITRSTQAYKLFSDGSTPEEVAIALNLRQPQETELYTEHWKLNGLYMLDQIYEEIRDDIGYFVNLYRLAKAAGMNVQHVNRLLEIANNDLPAVELRYERLKREAATLEFDRANSAREFQQLNEHIIMMRKTRDSTHLDYEKEMERLRHLQQQRMKQEAFVKQFENNNEEYVKIRKTVEEKVHSIMSDRRMVLKLALLSLIESMRKDPDKHSHLIYNNNTPSAPPRTQATDYHTASYGQQQQYPSQAYTDMLLEEAEKLYNKLAKESVDEIITDYAFSTSSSLLPVLPPFEEPFFIILIIPALLLLLPSFGI
jgi:hypothetical protein